jgi:hypothetical protein
LTKEALVYFFVCNQLWSVYSAFYYLELKLRDRRALQHERKWDHKADNLTRWLSDECHYAAVLARPKSGERERLYRAAEIVGDSLTYQAADELWKAARKAQEKYPLMAEDLLVYHLYCQWFSRVLVEFDHLITQDLGLTEFPERYQKKVTEFQELGSLLNTATLGEIEGMRPDAEILAGELASEWRQSIFSAVSEFDKNDTMG